MIPYHVNTFIHYFLILGSCFCWITVDGSLHLCDLTNIICCYCMNAYCRVHVNYMVITNINSIQFLGLSIDTTLSWKSISLYYHLN
jgi:hypothetical protein